MIFAPLLRERFVLACRRDHVMASRRSLRWAELRDHELISVDKSSGNRLLLDQALAGVSGLPQPVFESRHVQTLLGMVEAGLGVAAVPRLAMPVGETSLVAVPLTAPVVHRELGLITRRGRRLSAVAAELLRFLRETRGRAAAGET